MSDLRRSLMWPWRLRFVLFALGLAGLYGIVEALFWRDIPKGNHGVVLGVGGAFLFLSYGLLYWLYHKLTEDLMRPLLALGRDLEAQNQAGASIDQGDYHGSLIAPFVSELVRKELDHHDDEEMDDPSENWLSELLHVLDQGLIVATMEHQILLINARAREMLGRDHALALGRDLSKLVDIPTIDRALERQLAQDSVGSERLFCRFLRDHKIMPARVSVLHQQSHRPLGYVLAFHDITNQLYRTQELELGFDALLRDARDFAGEVSLLRQAGQSSNAAEQRFAESLMQHKADGQAHLGAAWPKGRMTLQNLFRVLRQNVEDVNFVTPPERVFLRCDGAALIEMLEHLLNELKGKGYALSMNFELQDQDVKIQIASQSKRIAIGDVEDVMRRALTRLPTAPTGHEVLRAHGTEIWPHMEDDRTHLVFILKRVLAQTHTPNDVMAARPEYYDFEAKRPVGKIRETRLRDLSVVVFDTETTGLDPKGGDQVVQISSVRVQAGKPILAESFDELVNPGRKIPPASTKIHGITDDRVKDARNFDEVVRDFYDYCDGEVLLAHNAAFDMAFLRRGASAAQLSFDQPVLDTVFMSAFLFDYSGQHTLDDLVRRFDIDLPAKDRHTALGDAIATAKAFCKMLPMLEARGVETLGQMLDIGQEMRAIRKRQQIYG